MNGASTLMRAAMLAVAASAAPAAAQSATPFKLGTFEDAGREFVGLVLDDTRVLDIAQANAAFESANPAAARVDPPTDMRNLIERYETGLADRLRAIAAADAGEQEPYAFDYAALTVLPPVRPAVILNAGANYTEHAEGIIAQNARAAGDAGGPPPGLPPRPPSQSAPGLWERPDGDTRLDNPYLFLKSPTTVVGANDDVVMPRGRTQIDWECEFATVIGAQAKNVPLEDAADYIFGYTIEFDVSDRGGRNDRKMGGGPDWLVQKNHDTFGPLGPFIVPKEFLPEPMNTRHYFTLNGETMQDSNTSRMEYDIYDMLTYASNIMTLNPGDVIAHGSPAGTNIEREDPRWMQAGDVGMCVIEGVGVQRHTIVAQE